MRRWFGSLGGKILWGTLLSVFVVPAGLGSVVFWRHYQLEMQADQSAEDILALSRTALVAEMERAMHLRQIEGVRLAVERIVGRRGVRAILLTDRNGVVVVSTRKERQFSLVEDAPFRTALRSGQEVVRQEPTAGAVLYRVAIPLLNKTECQGCHGEGPAVNGVLLAELAVLDLRSAFRSQLLALLGLFLVTGLTVAAIVYGPCIAA